LLCSYGVCDGDEENYAAECRKYRQVETIENIWKSIPPASQEGLGYEDDEGVDAFPHESGSFREEEPVEDGEG